MDRQLTPVEGSILCRKDRRTGLKPRLDEQTEKRWARLIDEYDLGADHLQVLSRRGKYQLDWVGREMWAKLVKKKSLSADDLRASIKRGTVTRIKRERGSTAAGMATWNALALDFEILRRQIGDRWKTWTIDDIDLVLLRIEKIIRFAGLLQSRKRELAADGKPGATPMQKFTTTQSYAGEPQDLSKGLRKWRKREVLTQPLAAKSLGVPIGTYRDWEQGRRMPRGPAFWNIQRRISQD